jgi:3-oxoacyl-[acyl-carrier protein] reductase
MTSLEGQVALVTGGSKGIGLAIGESLAKAGVSVVLNGREQGRLKASVSRLAAEGLKVEGLAGDVGVQKEIEEVVAKTVERHGRIDILVNNAGIGVFRSVLELAPEEFDRMWTTNLRGAYLATRAVLPHMIRAKQGDMVFISSLAGKNTFAGGAGYCATKWGMRGFAGSLMLEAREHNIRVITIAPGSVATEFSAGAKKGENIPRPEDVAEAVLFGLSAPRRAMFSEIDLRPTRP